MLASIVPGTWFMMKHLCVLEVHQLCSCVGKVIGQHCERAGSGLLLNLALIGVPQTAEAIRPRLWPHCGGYALSAQSCTSLCAPSR